MTDLFHHGLAVWMQPCVRSVIALQKCSFLIFFLFTYSGILALPHFHSWSLFCPRIDLSHFPEASSTTSKRFLRPLLTDDPSQLSSLLCCWGSLAFLVRVLWALLGHGSNAPARFSICLFLPAATCSYFTLLRKPSSKEKWEITDPWPHLFLQIACWSCRQCFANKAVSH